jgi:outer membrane receptor protein involved in Fe transport
MDMSFAQVGGLVTDDQGEALPMASVALYQEDQLQEGVSTDVNGRFSIEVSPGDYQLQISFVGFETLVKTIAVKPGAPLKLGNLSLKQSNNQLEEVTVAGEAKMMEFEQDKRVFNVAKDLANTAGNASDILNNVPSVTVDVEGAVSLRGSQNVRILINGKPSGLIGSDPAAGLRQLQANMIEKIEVITNPSARYDAEGDAGIINIILKKQDQKGLNGSFDVSAGYPELAGAGASLNYRRNKLNFFTNLSFNYNRAPGNSIAEQRFDLPDTSYSFLRDRDQSRGGSDATLRFGADYYLTSDQILTGSFLFRPSRDNNLVDITYTDINQGGEVVREVNRFDDELETESNLEGNISWEKRFGGSDKHKWVADLRYSLEDEREQNTITQDTTGVAGELIQKVDNIEKQRSFLAQTDYIHPLGEKTSYELGSRVTLRTIRTDYTLADQASDGSLNPVDGFDNEFEFIENVYAAYGLYNGALGDKITYQLGLRAEYTDLSTQLDTASEANQRDYANLFPSAFFTYSFGPLSDIQISYSRRITRPGFWRLNPFFSFSDNRIFFSGNPNVNPEFSDNYEMGYVRYFEKGSLYSGIYYRHRTDVVERVSIVEIKDGEEFTRIFPINLATQDAYGLEFNFQYEFADWYEVTANLNLFRAITVGNYEGQDFGADNFSSSGRLINRFEVWNSDLQASFNLRGAATTPQGRSLGIYTLDLGWSKDILKGNGTITLSVRDLFNTRYRRSYTSGITESGGTFNQYSRFQWRERQINVNFTYRLNQKKGRARSGGQPEFGGEGF